jgi:alpha-glucosidase/alpha-D-xyloside xylohydrolase
MSEAIREESVANLDLRSLMTSSSQPGFTTMPISRRTALKCLGVPGTTTLLSAGSHTVQAATLRLVGRAVELTVAPVGASIVRISVVPVEEGRPASIPTDGSLVPRDWDPPVARLTTLAEPRSLSCGDARVSLSAGPLTIRVAASDGRLVQELRLDEPTGSFTFHLGDGPVFGLGEGGPQFDRRGSVDRMRSGQGGYRLRTHGGRVPVPWLIGTAGWAMFVHQPAGTFDLTGADGRFAPVRPQAALPLDVFIVTARDPARVMAEFARLTGHPELPPLWALGYQQSHRTLASRDEVLSIARTFREKKLPCDVLIYLGTGFCPSGWNTGHGSFTFNPSAFPDPKAMLDELRAMHFHVVPHVVIRSKALRGSARDPIEPGPGSEEHAAAYWDAHRGVFSLGVNGWWPDEGDPLDVASRLARIRMYWEGPQVDRPDVRPFALHRNGYAGMQRYAAFLWSGDVDSSWETLRTHVPVAINTSLTGMPYWGTDTGGFVPTKELTGELYVRWFQFSAFCPLFRSHGRTWKIRLPWGWNTGELGPNEIRGYGYAANPDPGELHNAAVEPICRQYLELRYRLIPYLYSVVRECCLTGLPIIRALWLRYPDDPRACGRGDEFLWGPDILVAPVTQKGATMRRLYLPRGRWYDFWTGEPIEGGREIERPVDLATIPLYVRAGAILPLGPVRQYTGEPTEVPLVLRIYPGADGRFLLYEDDGVSFAYRKGDWMGLELSSDDRNRRLSLRLARRSRMRPPLERRIEVHRMTEKSTSLVIFSGKPVDVHL